MKKNIVIVGASTGGPTLIKKLISSLDSLSSTIIIAQHMKEEVLPFFIKELNESTSIDVFKTPSVLNFHVPAVYVCSESSTLIKKNSSYELETDKNNQHFTPDIDKLLNSFCGYEKEFEITIIIMTGMGRDGVNGATNLKKCGAKIIAQDQKSSPLYGMPKAAYEANIVDEVKSFDEIQAYFQGLS